MKTDLDLLAFGPHPDDVELSCGGWLALAGRQGHRVGVIDLTRGELATNGTPAERADEAQAAAEVLGLTVRENLELPDGDLRAEDADQLAAIVETIRHHRPRLVLGPWTQARHPDHAAAAALIHRAAFMAGLVKYRPDLGPSHRPLRLVAYPQRHEVVPSFVVDVTEVHSQKTAAIRCHVSQFGGGASPTLINSPVGFDAFTTRDRYWGASIGVAFAEPYIVAGPLPVSDPITHFIEHPMPPALVPSR
ncbi:MAG: bacillithiol biosynthesis deacetylase BshB1 [Myxococcales bacterium]|nr:bacillithiol biosynthesis deacetylase BshB1 [Myxococcales bacterium]